MRSSKNSLNKPLSQILGTTLSFGLFLYFGYHLIHGDHGYFAQKGLEQKLVAAEKTYNDKKEERTALENRVKRLRPDSLDVDLLDERARVVLGFLKADEKVIIERN